MPSTFSFDATFRCHRLLPLILGLWLGACASSPEIASPVVSSPTLPWEETADLPYLELPFLAIQSANEPEAKQRLAELLAEFGHDTHAERLVTLSLVTDETYLPVLHHGYFHFEPGRRTEEGSEYDLLIFLVTPDLQRHPASPYGYVELDTAQRFALPHTDMAHWLLEVNNLTAPNVPGSTPIDSLHALTEQGNSSAMVALGTVLLQGAAGADKDEDTALAWFRRAAALDNAYGHQALASYHASLPADEQGQALILSHYTQAAELGSREAAYQVGNLLRAGSNGQPDLSSALFWYQTAASQRHLAAIDFMLEAYQGQHGSGFQDEKLYLSWLQAGAEMGHAAAQRELALRYRAGEGVEQSDALFIELLGKSAMLDDMEALSLLAHAYLHGEGTEQDLSRALNLLRIAANGGEHKAIITLADMHFNGDHVRQDQQAALQFYLQVAEQSSVEITTRLGRMYLEALGTRRDNVQAEYWLRKSLENLDGREDADTHFYLGSLLLQTGKDEEGLTHLRTAASLEHSGAIAAVGLWHVVQLQQEDSTEHLEQAAFWLHQVAGEEDPAVLKALSHIEDRRGNHDTAQRLLHTQVSSGDPQAAYMLAFQLMKTNNASEETLQRAYALLKDAAVGGVPEGIMVWSWLVAEGKMDDAPETIMALAEKHVASSRPDSWEQATHLHQLATLHYQGRITATDHDRAFELASRAASLGFPPAQHFLGTLYDFGEGTTEDKVMAYVWIARAERAGYRDAPDYRQDLESMMRPEQLRKALEYLDGRQ